MTNENPQIRQDADLQPETIRNYYKWQAAIYDLTRWSFLFGRAAITRQLGLPADSTATLLEVGCGTGHNLRRLAAAYPKLRLAGVDVSPDMLKRARAATLPYADRVHFFEMPYGSEELPLSQKPDIILFSYSLTMFNPGWEEAIRRAAADLRPGGRIAVVDFHDTPLRAFRYWLEQNHVRFDGHLLPVLESGFKTVYKRVQPVYGGLWRYMMFVGTR